MKSRSYVFGFLALFGFVLSACAPEAPPVSAALSSTAPELGSLMAWVDGSTLVFIPETQARLPACAATGLCDVQFTLYRNGSAPEATGGSGAWLTLNPISNYQFSLCVQAGDCKAPSASEYGDPARETAPVSIVGPDIVGPDRSAGYCAWIGGRVPTDAEIAAMGDASVHTALGGADLLGNLHCIVDAPRPRPLYFQTSPYYDASTSMAEMLAKPASNQTFCQNGQANATLDLALPADHSIHSIKGDGHTQCQQVSSNRILCGGDPGANPQIEVGLVCNALGVFNCQPGSTLQNAACTNNMHGAAIAGMDDWEMDSNGALVPVNSHQLPGGAIGGPITHPFHLLDGVMVAQSLSSNALASNSLSGNELSTNGLSGNAVAGNEASGNGLLVPAVCPVGFFADGNASNCTSLGQSEPTCLDGFIFDATTKTCKAAKADGNYPGCPVGQLFDPSTAACDANTQIVSATELIHTQSFEFSLPDCTQKSNSDKDAGAGKIVCLKNCP